MAILEIISIPNPVLKKKSKAVTEINDDIIKLINDMFETMYDAPGIGLAAPQVGVSLRVIVLDPAHDDEPPCQFAMINPEIIEKSEEIVVCNEGCLSVPKQFAEVERPEKIKVRWIDIDGNQKEMVAEGMLARVIQHETDHLNGILFIDHISRLKRSVITKKVIKAKEETLEEQE